MSVSSSFLYIMVINSVNLLVTFCKLAHSAVFYKINYEYHATKLITTVKSFLVEGLYYKTIKEKIYIMFLFYSTGAIPGNTL